MQFAQVKLVSLTALLASTIWEFHSITTLRGLRKLKLIAGESMVLYLQRIYVLDFSGTVHFRLVVNRNKSSDIMLL